MHAESAHNAPARFHYKTDVFFFLFGIVSDSFRKNIFNSDLKNFEFGFGFGFEFGFGFVFGFVWM